METKEAEGDRETPRGIVSGKGHRMNYEENTIQWRIGDIVIHDADAKEPRLFMRIDGFTLDGLAMCRYVNPNQGQGIYKNRLASLHDPSRFGLLVEWAALGWKRLETIQRQWDWARRWNYYRGVGVAVRTTSADGGFETVTVSKAAVWNTGLAMVNLARGGWWVLDFVEVVPASQTPGEEVQA
jgi:hypothetical protein